MAKGEGRRVLVTGGAGFIGSHVCEQFLHHGWRVDIVDNLVTGKRVNVPRDATFHEVDIGSRDAAQLVRDGGFDVLVHLAAQMDVRRSVADPVFDATTNVVGTLNLLEAVRASGRRTRTVFSSTGGALYGEFTTPPNEETFVKDPESPYAISKLAAEYYLAYYGRVHGLENVALRFGNVYGPRQDPHGEAGVVAIFCGRILDGQPLTVFGDGKQTRDYVYVGDVARATYIGATAPLPEQAKLDSRAFNIGTGTGRSVLDLVETLQRVTAREANVTFAPRRPGEQQHSSLYIEKTRRELGWTPEISLEEGLRRTFEWFAERAGATRGAGARA